MGLLHAKYQETQYGKEVENISSNPIEGNQRSKATDYDVGACEDEVKHKCCDRRQEESPSTIISTEAC